MIRNMAKHRRRHAGGRDATKATQRVKELRASVAAVRAAQSARRQARQQAKRKTPGAFLDGWMDDSFLGGPVTFAWVPDDCDLGLQDTADSRTTKPRNARRTGRRNVRSTRRRRTGGRRTSRRGGDVPPPSAGDRTAGCSHPWSGGAA